MKLKAVDLKVGLIQRLVRMEESGSKFDRFLELRQFIPNGYCLGEKDLKNILKCEPNNEQKMNYIKLLYHLLDKGYEPDEINETLQPLIEYEFKKPDSEIKDVIKDRCKCYFDSVSLKIAEKELDDNELNKFLGYDLQKIVNYEIAEDDAEEIIKLYIELLNYLIEEGYKADEINEKLQSMIIFAIEKLTPDVVAEIAQDVAEIEKIKSNIKERHMGYLNDMKSKINNEALDVSPQEEILGYALEKIVGYYLHNDAKDDAKEIIVSYIELLHYLIDHNHAFDSINPALTRVINFAKENLSPQANIEINNIIERRANYIKSNIGRDQFRITKQNIFLAMKLFNECFMHNQSSDPLDSDIFALTEHGNPEELYFDANGKEPKKDMAVKIAIKIIDATIISKKYYLQVAEKLQEYGIKEEKVKLVADAYYFIVNKPTNTKWNELKTDEKLQAELSKQIGYIENEAEKRMLLDSYRKYIQADLVEPVEPLEQPMLQQAQSEASKKSNSGSIFKYAFGAVLGAVWLGFGLSAIILGLRVPKPFSSQLFIGLLATFCAVTLVGGISLLAMSSSRFKSPGANYAGVPASGQSASEKQSLELTQ